MTTMRSVARWAVVLAFATVACSEDTTAPVSTGVLSLELRAPNDSLFLGRTVQLVADASVDSSIVTRPAVTWSSSDTTTAVVTEDGLITAVATGAVVITVVAADKQSQVSVRVVPMRVAPDGMSATVASTVLGRICGLTPQGRAACLEEPSAPDTVPRFVLHPDAMSQQFVQFASGAWVDCGLTASGEMWCARFVRNYILATAADAGDLPVFRRVRSPVPFSQIVLGGVAGACGIGRDDQRAYCWGHSGYGLMGRPDAVQPSDSTVAPITGSPQFSRLAASFNIMCGVGTDGVATCWGAAAALRDMQPVTDTAQFTGSLAWMPRRLLNASAFTALAGDDYATCGLTADGTAHCWGRPTTNAFHGNFGRGNFDEAPGVAPVATTARFRSLSADFWQRPQFCGVTTTDEVHCWGRVLPLALHTALGARSNRPTALIRGVPIESVAMTDGRRCAVTRTGGAVCW